MEENNISRPRIYSVSELNSNIKKSLEQSFYNIWVEGEVSNFYFHNNRHMYFDLKDEYSKIKVVMFYQQNKNLLFDIADGLHILVNGYVSLYEKRGEYQVIAADVKPVGKGSLILAFEQLKEKLEKRGYFDAEIKKQIPLLPKKIGLATSTGGAVIRDIISVLNRRSGKYHLIVRNVNVQGIASAEEVCEAIDDLSNYGVNVIIIARGGGSLEDLWGFNTEILADKIISCNTPIISAIGHETDYTISDFVADIRAATPSVAAEMVTLDKTKAVEDIEKLKARLNDVAGSIIKQNMRELHYLIDRKVFRQPQSILSQSWQLVDDYHLKLITRTSEVAGSKSHKLSIAAGRLSYRSLTQKIDNLNLTVKGYHNRLESSISSIAKKKRNQVELLLKSLQHNSPAYILGKGFGIVYDEKKRVVRSINQVRIGQKIKVTLSNGSLISNVLRKLSEGQG